MDFTGDAITSHGVLERRFDVAGEGGPVPGLLWTSEGASGPRPLVLIGHGGTSHKRTPYVLSLARRLVRHADYAVAAIDAPYHGDRADPDGSDALTDGKRFRELLGAANDRMTADWHATVKELQQLDHVGDGPLGYWGLSMGTMLGLPLVAATPAIRCAVLGLMGTFTDQDPWTVAAPKLACPVLFLLQTDDELVPLERGIALFNTIASADRRLHAHPGRHSAVPVEEMEASEAFFALHL